MAYSPVSKGIACPDDSLAYTMDYCDGLGACIHPQKGICALDSQTFEGGIGNPNNECEWCDSAENPTDWTDRQKGFPCSNDGLACTLDVCDAGICTHPLATGCLIDNACIEPGASSPDTDCMACDPVSNSIGYSPRPVGHPCDDDGLTYTLDVCNDAGACEHPDKGICAIGNTTFSGGATNPDNECQWCMPEDSMETWSNRIEGYPCDSDKTDETQETCDGQGTCKAVVMPVEDVTEPGKDTEDHDVSKNPDVDVSTSFASSGCTAGIAAPHLPTATGMALLMVLVFTTFGISYHRRRSERL